MFKNPTLLIGVVEHTVVLDDPRRPSQNDLWGILGTDFGHVSMSVEAKAGEPFDKTIAGWLKDGSEGKEQRLQFLCDKLAVVGRPPDQLRYQLFHRAGSAVIEAKRWRLSTALMIVQSFAESRTSWPDYEAFAALLGIKAERNKVVGVRDACGVQLYLLWIESPLATDNIAATAV